MTTTVRGWHFCGSDGNGGITLRDGTSVPAKDIRKWLPEVKAPLLCESGYHASVLLRDALSYAPTGEVLCYVEVRNPIHGADKVVGTSRRVLRRFGCHGDVVEMARRESDQAQNYARLAAAYASGNTDEQLPAYVDHTTSFVGKFQGRISDIK